MQRTFFILLIFTILKCTNLSAQSYKNDLKIGVGYANYPSPNVSNISFYGEFSRPFLPKTTVGISASVVSPEEYVEAEVERKLTSYHFAMNLYFNVIDEQNQILKTGLGFSAGIFDIDWKVIDTGQKGRDHTFQPGLAVLLEYNLIINKQIILGVATKGILYGENKSLIFGGIHGGLKF